MEYQRPTRAGAKSAYDRQVSKKGRELLLWLLRQQRQMEQGTPEERQELQNEGIPWQASAAASALDVMTPSVTRTLAALERRRLVFCWATGQGKGRRVSHVKLTWAAEERAQEEERMGMSIFQSTRKHAREWRERQERLENPAPVDEPWGQDFDDS